MAVALEDEQGVKLAFTVGTMIELPRAAMAAWRQAADDGTKIT